MEEYRIIKALSGFYYVQTESGVVECRARGRLRRQDAAPLVGDFVRISRQGAKGVLEELLPRRNAFIRPAIANIDQLIVLASCAIPVTEPFLIDRVLAIARMQGVETVVCINKDDLASAQPLAEIYCAVGVPVLITSAQTGQGIDALRALLRGKLSCLTGNSGVGKSSLLNCVCPSLTLATGEISEKLGRGRHTTRHIELYTLDAQTFVADTPGFSAFDTERMELVRKQQLQAAFVEFEPYLGRCQFQDCTHRKEPGCAIKQALADGAIQSTRYESYLRLYEQASQIPDWERKENHSI